MSPCAMQYQGRDSSAYTPRCQYDGSFEEQQCAEDVCFCVEGNGAIIPRTSVLLSNGRPNCTATQPGKNFLRVIQVLTESLLVSEPPFLFAELMTDYLTLYAMCNE